MQATAATPELLPDTGVHSEPEATWDADFVSP